MPGSSVQKQWLSLDYHTANGAFIRIFMSEVMSGHKIKCQTGHSLDLGSFKELGNILQVTRPTPFPVQFDLWSFISLNCIFFSPNKEKSVKGCFVLMPGLQKPK